MAQKAEGGQQAEEMNGGFQRQKGSRVIMQRRVGGGTMTMTR
jgi:hypothetical protein